MEPLKERFFDLCGRIGLDNPEHAYNEMQKYYSRPKRFYHNFNHIRMCLDEFSDARHFVQNPDALEFAIFFHDIICEPSLDDNEERSARLAYHLCKGCGADKEFARNVMNLILMTKHDGNADDINLTLDSRLIADIDLAILGKPAAEFDKYEQAIRKEYAHLPEDLYARERIRLLRDFLKRGIYQTIFFISRYDLKARENLERAIQRLRSKQ